MTSYPRSTGHDDYVWMVNAAIGADHEREAVELAAGYRSDRPVLAEIDGPPGPQTAARVAAREADARGLPLKLLLTRPVSVWASPIAMGVYRPDTLDGDRSVARARGLVEEIKGRYPGLPVSATVVRDATVAVRRESADASLLVIPDSRDGDRLRRKVRCAVITCADGDAA
jgi:hypothetical protein